MAAGIALAVKKGELPESQLRGASKEMHDSMSNEELEKFAGTKHKGLKKRKKKDSSLDIVMREEEEEDD